MEESSLHDVGWHIRQKLWDIGIDTLEKLFDTTKTYKERRVLAQKLGVSKERLFSFVNIHDFLRLPAMNLDIAKLFDNAGFETVGSLRHLPLEKLTQVLQTSGIDTNMIPSGDTLKDILSQATDTPLKIFGYDRIHTEEEREDDEEEVPMMKPKKQKKTGTSVWWKYLLLGLILAGLLFAFQRYIAAAIAGLVTFLWILIRFFPKLFTGFIPQKLKQAVEVNKTVFSKWDTRRKMVANMMMVLPVVTALVVWFLPQGPKPMHESKKQMPPIISIDTAFEKDLQTLKEVYATKEITREMLLKLLILEKERKNVDAAKWGCFVDVVGSKFEKYVCYAKDAWLVQGRSATTFDPKHKVTKAEALKMIYNVFGVPTQKDERKTAFADVKESDWFAPYVAQGEKLWLLEKLPSFKPNEFASFKFIDKTISRVLKLQNEKEPTN